MVTKIESDVKRDDITGRLGWMFDSMDKLDWDAVRKVLADQVEFDSGKGPEQKSADEVIATWKDEYKKLDGLQHLTAAYGIEVFPTEARIKFKGITTHFKRLKSGKDTKTIYGDYEVTMVPATDPLDWAWKVSKFKHNKRFLTGNLSL